MNYVEQYARTVTGILDAIRDTQQEAMSKAARLIADTLRAGRVLHVIGTGGHSSMAGEEVFYRAGGLVPVNAILDAGITLHGGAIKSTLIERTPGYGRALLRYYGVKADDVLLIASAYGINSVTIDVALGAKEAGAQTIGVTARGYEGLTPPGSPARHPSGKHLSDLVDVWIDTHVPGGDAVVNISGFDQPVAPVSTIANSFTLHAIVIKTVEALVAEGVTPPVWKSAYLPGADEWNQKFVDEYSWRLKHL